MLDLLEYTLSQIERSVIKQPLGEWGSTPSRGN
jgi:hypothetical protein